MRDAVVAELRKLRSTRMWWILMFGLVGYVGFMGVVMAFSLSYEPAGGREAAGMPLLDGREIAQSVYGLLNPIGYVFPLIIGSMLMTGEFRHRTITQSLLVEPRRSVLLGAKLVVAVPLGLAYGVVGTLALVAGAAPVLATMGDGAYLTDGDVVRSLLLGVLVLAVWTMFGCALGSVLPNQVAALCVILGFTQLVEPIARVALGAVDAVSGAAAYLPGAAADAIVGSSLFASFGGSGDLLPRAGGFAVLLGYVVVLAVIGRFTTLRRDVG